MHGDELLALAFVVLQDRVLVKPASHGLPCPLWYAHNQHSQHCAALKHHRWTLWVCPICPGLCSTCPLACLHAQMTDVQAALAHLPADSSAAVKLGVLAQLSLARPVAAVWLMPLTDLLVRAKLNIIGMPIASSVTLPAQRCLVLTHMHMLWELARRKASVLAREAVQVAAPRPLGAAAGTPPCRPHVRCACLLSCTSSCPRLCGPCCRAAPWLAGGRCHRPTWHQAASPHGCRCC